MLKHTFLLITGLLCMGLAAGDVLDQPHIVVYGTAEIRVTPNEMNWVLNVRNEAKELPATASAHAATVKKVLDFLKSQKIDERKLQTSQMQFGENWKYIDRENVKVGYYASTSISFTIYDFDLYEPLWFGLAGIEGVSIQNVSYAQSERIRYQNESRQKALLAAREKAANLAKTLRMSIGEALTIEETTPQISPRILTSNFASNSAYDVGDSAAAQGLAVGQLTISTNVKVVFQLKE